MMRAMKALSQSCRDSVRGLFTVLTLFVCVQCGHSQDSTRGYNWDTINYVNINRTLKAQAEEQQYKDVDADYEAPAVFGACGGGDDLSNFTCK